MHPVNTVPEDLEHEHIRLRAALASVGELRPADPGISFSRKFNIFRDSIFASWRLKNENYSPENRICSL